MKEKGYNIRDIHVLSDVYVLLPIALITTH